MNWNADYVLTVSRDEKFADLNGWVTLVNDSGAAYENANPPARCRKNSPGHARRLSNSNMAMSMETKAAAPPQFVQENFNEYHLYSLERKTSIENNESKQISLLIRHAGPGRKVPPHRRLALLLPKFEYR